MVGSALSMVGCCAPRLSPARFYQLAHRPPSQGVPVALVAGGPRQRP